MNEENFEVHDLNDHQLITLVKFYWHALMRCVQEFMANPLKIISAAFLKKKIFNL